MKRLLILLLFSALISGCISDKPYEPTNMQARGMECNKDFDCVIRYNNLGRVRACHKDDVSCTAWGRTPEYGVAGEEYPRPGDVYSHCIRGSCVIKYNPDRCGTLKAEFEESCPTQVNGTWGKNCAMYYEACYQAPAANAKNQTICENVKQEDFRKRCIASVQQNIGLCAQIKIDWIKKLCQTDLA